MTQNSIKNLNTWTEKHNKLCYENKLSPCAKSLWQWLLEHKDDEPDLKEFNKFVSKYRGKPYCRPHLKAAFNQLVECRVIRLVKQFTWHLVRIVTRSLADLFPKKKCRHGNKIFAKQASDDQIEEKSKTGLNNNSKCSYTLEEKKVIIRELASKSIRFNFKPDLELFDYYPDEIEIALAYYLNLPSGAKARIFNLPGWFLCSLREAYFVQPTFLDVIAQLEKIVPINW